GSQFTSQFLFTRRPPSSSPTDDNNRVRHEYLLQRLKFVPAQIQLNPDIYWALSGNLSKAPFLKTQQHRWPGQWQWIRHHLRTNKRNLRSQALGQCAGSLQSRDRRVNGGKDHNDI